MEYDSDKDDESHINLLGEIVSSIERHTIYTTNYFAYGIDYHFIAS